jgi:hypothetical protein
MYAELEIKSRMPPSGTNLFVNRIKHVDVG